MHGQTVIIDELFHRSFVVYAYKNIANFDKNDISPYIIYCLIPAWLYSL